MNDCADYIQQGVLLRSFFTVLLIPSLFLYAGKYLYLLLPIALLLLDTFDNIYFVLKEKKECSRLFDYQMKDKIIDSLSYVWTILFLFFLKGDSLLLFFVMYRIVGVVLFYYSRNSCWLILFFDFVKEYLLYVFVFGKNYSYLPAFILCKIGGEYLWHTYKNPNHYKIDSST